MKPKILAISGVVMITALVITFFVAYGYATPTRTNTENQEYGECHDHYHDEHHERHYHWEEEHNDIEGLHHHHHDGIEEEQYRNHGCH